MDAIKEKVNKLKERASKGMDLLKGEKATTVDESEKNKTDSGLQHSDSAQQATNHIEKSSFEQLMQDAKEKGKDFIHQALNTLSLSEDKQAQSQQVTDQAKSREEIAGHQTDQSKDKAQEMAQATQFKRDEAVQQVSEAANKVKGQDPAGKTADVAHQAKAKVPEEIDKTASNSQSIATTQSTIEREEKNKGQEKKSEHQDKKNQVKDEQEKKDKTKGEKKDNTKSRKKE